MGAFRPLGGVFANVCVVVAGALEGNARCGARTLANRRITDARDLTES